MTTITFALARAIGRELKAGRNRRHHSGPRRQRRPPGGRRRKGRRVVRPDIREADCTLDLDDLKRNLATFTLTEVRCSKDLHRF